MKDRQAHQAAQTIIDPHDFLYDDSRSCLLFSYNILYHHLPQSCPHYHCHLSTLSLPVVTSCIIIFQQSCSHYHCHLLHVTYRHICIKIPVTNITQHYKEKKKELSLYIVTLSCLNPSANYVIIILAKYS